MLGSHRKIYPRDEVASRIFGLVHSQHSSKTLNTSSPEPKTRFGNLKNLSFPPLCERDISVDLNVK